MRPAAQMSARRRPVRAQNSGRMRRQTLRHKRTARRRTGLPRLVARPHFRLESHGSSKRNRGPQRNSGHVAQRSHFRHEPAGDQ